jgi:hypothetical protein
MKKTIASLLLVAFVCSLAPELLAAKVVSRRPVFPVLGKKKAVKPKPLGKVVELGSPVPTTPPAKPTLKSGWSAEGGLGGGAILLEGVYQKGLSDKLAARFGAGYGLGGKFGVMVVEAGACYDLGSFQVGGGLNYAAYSELVSGVPGLSGTISNKNLVGVELFGVTKIRDKWGARVGYSTALGLRLAASYGF